MRTIFCLSDVRKFIVLTSGASYNIEAKTGGYMANKYMQKLKHELNKAENKAHEAKGRAEQKAKDM